MCKLRANMGGALASRMEMVVNVDRAANVARFIVTRDNGDVYNGEYNAENARMHGGAIVNADNFLALIEEFAILGRESCALEVAPDGSKVTVKVRVSVRVAGDSDTVDNLEIVCPCALIALRDKVCAVNLALAEVRDALKTVDASNAEMLRDIKAIAHSK